MKRWLKAMVDLRHWLSTGGAWHWHSLATITISGFLIIALFFLVITQGLAYFWPSALEEWVVQSVEETELPSGENIKTERLFAYMIEQTDRMRSIDSQSADIEVAQGEQIEGTNYLLRYQAFSDGQFDWRYRRVNDDDVIRVTRTLSLMEVAYKDGSKLFGYPLLIDTGVRQIDGVQLTELVDNNSWDALVALDSSPSGAGTSVPHLILQLHDGVDFNVDLSKVKYLTYPNIGGWFSKVKQFFRNIRIFLSSDPLPGYQGGIWPAIYGTVLLVILMSVILVPLGVITAVYLHEYASNNLMTKVLRVAVSNLAGIPGIVYGVFVLGVFVYGMGAQIDQWFFNAQLPLPTFGTGGLFWASLALALLTLPVVIVATEEGLARVPQDLRNGALALGATRTEMVWGVVVNAASPAILTGLILAIARAAGEVAPLLLVGAVKYTGQPLLEAEFPYLHGERQFMHLGYQVYDFALQSTDSHASIPLAYATTLILLALVVCLNLMAIRLRSRLRQRFLVSYS